ncbi:bifunctional N-acetylglucosamine-1-phosphate uridyltransferase/glucosamine-1-phosphate acetyltransferase [Mycobacteroides abscessus subsp. abscessus]|uniref:Bifunctional protein GlmU n=1 Tax=Dermabacter vaginalis TaxID=1630135 RepID=A0A1B0ZHJ2_9MICO|nr:bifunctional UDP-N-acetylglucosamine diphosphorylase/glucosamine-1-phosphate N-acetyltransferase GlmU [Dermabacter vaginalis]ANP27454.1 UDP-N-acetylglucosamine diphosphorylase/glucosamine-1-phosphate N-acetyltransferase [Dermabacter vaginalis]SHW51512.1 bifunctional N-acetylglucosamine-1-phosphate uridyltransferase/glucosamine-1-phosphate acetyltransferase [Mycobacteroides abscessus subsp. abscessus]
MVTHSPAAVVVLAAGAGTRMKSALPKVLHPVCGTSMLMHAITAARATGAEEIVAVVRHKREQVLAHLEENAPEVTVADQDEIPGTGRAVQCGLDKVEAAVGTVLVTYGDVPLLQGDTLRAFVEAHEATHSSVSILTARVADPTGYGRIVRSADGTQVDAIVEHKDASEEQRAINEINSGICAFDLEFLREALTKVGTDNSQGEMYLTDVPGIARAEGKKVSAYVTDDPIQVEGANDRVQLSALGAEMNRRTLVRHMRAGVSIIDPHSTFIDPDVEIGEDTTILPGVQLHGRCVIGSEVTVGPDTTLTDVTIHDRAEVVRTHGFGAVIGEGATVGPFTYLRPGTVLGKAGKIGGFCETKNAQIGDGAKVPHLSYVGDAEIGEGTNIGAATIFANYDGVHKHRSVVGKHVRVGSDSVLVAPVTIGDGAATGAGTVVLKDVPPGALAVNNTKPRITEGWTLTKRAGTASAEAAENALDHNSANATTEEK